MSQLARICTRNKKFEELISIKAIEFIVKNLSTKKAPDPDGVTGEFYQTLTNEILAILKTC